MKGWMTPRERTVATVMVALCVVGVAYGLYTVGTASDGGWAAFGFLVALVNSVSGGLIGFYLWEDRHG